MAVFSARQDEPNKAPHVNGKSPSIGRASFPICTLSQPTSTVTTLSSLSTVALSAKCCFMLHRSLFKKKKFYYPQAQLNKAKCVNSIRDSEYHSPLTVSAHLGIEDTDNVSQTFPADVQATVCLALADVAIELINIGVRYTVRVVFFSRLSLSLCLFICADEIELRVGSLRLVLCNSVRLYPNIPFCSSHDSTGSVHMYPA
ncbi:hypothetical protein J3E68DRAFT_347499 [Trichoderma sp. SZMC 28012]